MEGLFIGGMITEDVPGGGTGTSFWEDEVGRVRLEVEDHVAGVVAKDGIRVVMEVIH